MECEAKAAREVNLEDVRQRLVSCFEHAGGIINRCAELKEHVDGSVPTAAQSDRQSQPRPSSGIVTDLAVISGELAERLQQIENLVARAANRLGVTPPPTNTTSLGSPRLARG